MQANYTKLKSGDWGIRVSSESVCDGQTVTVVKKSGGTKSETIARVIWRGNGVAICAIGASRRSGGSHSAHPWTGCSCGSREDLPRPSDCASCQHDY